MLKFSCLSSLLITVLGFSSVSHAAEPATPAPANEVVTPSDPITPLSTLAAGTGLFQTLTAVPGTPWTFGLALHMEFFRYGDFLVAGQHETNTRTAGGVHFHMFFPRSVEAFATIYSMSNINERDHLAGTGEPSTQMALGDLLFGAKYSHRVTPFLNVGGALVGRLYSGMAAPGPDLSATSAGLHLLASLDGRVLAPKAPFPFLVHLNLGYVYDGSSRLLGDVPRSADFATVEPLYGYMVQEFALGVAQSRVQFSLGFEAPLRVKGTVVSPVVEYGFRFFTDGADDTLMGWRNRVAVNGNVAADDTFSQNLTLGVRWHVTRQVALSAGVDLALDYPGFAVAPPQPVYNVFAMLSYQAAEAPGPCVPVVREVVKEVDRTPVAEPMGTIRGKVTDEQGAPLEGATVDFVGTQLPRQATDAQGGFTSIPVKPGNYTVRVGKKDFHDQELPVAVVRTDAPTEIQMKLRAKGPEQCSVYVFVKDDAGAPVGGTLKVQGKTMDEKDVSLDATLSAEGKAEVKVFPGAYEIVYSEPEHLTRSATVTLPKCTATPVELVVKKKPAKSTATINRKQRQITITERIQFKLDSAELLAESLIILDEVAALMIDNPEILELEIQGHTDDKGKADHNLKLSQDRADAVRAYVITQGVKGERLTAKGYGHTKPRFANISTRLREKNRRVEFKINKMKED